MEARLLLARPLADDEVTLGNAVTCHLEVWTITVDHLAAIGTRRA